ncbi:MAG: hypothetical protein AB7F23_03725 [Phycisphaerae bacterium]|jgi:hypothetical protein
MILRAEFLAALAAFALIGGCSKVGDSQIKGLKITDFSTLRTPESYEKTETAPVTYRVMAYSIDKRDFAKLRIGVNELVPQTAANISEAAALNNIFFARSAQGELSQFTSIMREANAKPEFKTNIMVYRDGFDSFELAALNGKYRYYNTEYDIKTVTVSGPVRMELASMIGAGNVLLTLRPYVEIGSGMPAPLELSRPEMRGLGKIYIDGCSMSCRIEAGQFVMILPDSIPLEEELFTSGIFAARDKNRMQFYCILCTRSNS